MATLGDLNEMLFRELDRLEELNGSDAEVREFEIQRAKAIEGLAHVTISNARTVMEGIRMQSDLLGGVKPDAVVPKMLSGE